MYKHLSCAAFKIKLTTGSGNASTCGKLHDRSRIRLRQKAGVCASALTVGVLYYHRKTQILPPAMKICDFFYFLTTFQNMLLVFVYHTLFA